ncbi:23S rRNA (uridine(2552)-2'-O)-methyltransferase RlmE [Alkalilimnicola sp. S0819]|uniref:23S rRNA (uridine(2552)-2'-O)-methyltransferase RlmE n=1 Tax=Alkalilimnicola sp. S0819 TaxID=2613922 RepID=UPI00126218F9|nr:23S rRNA (uridine(2552)-2'-O)-methyltransferase RlmE [Alkalilimnicola sp. S0819]KAB7628420.1 23S rRNA (uridine(2552)-2'-O)-methyltransferase RlmE [Alkalilimnicola sp. S0819]MPQ15323.1 23S rRNA (uridine(2552)-2'-O)-methyltransferase RlmE [Alkalilimnicola sp. S0819]
MPRSKSSRRWLKEHFDDVHVRRAQKEGWRSRAAFKLEEIQQKDRLLKAGQHVVDLGAAPGGWSQYAGRILGDRGRVVALDILPMDALADVAFIQADFTEDAALEQLRGALGGRPVDVVLSDMAPNITGQSAVDQPRAMYLAELALDFAGQVLRPGGDFLVKVFQGEGFEEYLRQLRGRFKRVVTRKPQASRPRSREVYLLARDFRV